MRSTAAEHTGSAGGGSFRLAGRAGVLSVALGVAGLILDQMWTFPATGATGADVARFVDAHRPALLLAMVLNACVVGLWLVFGAGIWRWLRDSTAGESDLSTCFLVGLVSFVTLLLAGFTSFFLLVYRAPEASDPRLLYDFGFALLAISGVPTALALGAYATHAFRDARLPTWSTWIATVAALAHLLLLCSLVIRSGFFSLTGGVTIAIPGTLFAWILATSVLLLRQSGVEPDALTPATSGTKKRPLVKTRRAQAESHP
jgi:hypothetical protein